MTTYGHFTVKGFEERRGNPYFEQHGQWYRITDHHVIHGLDRVNYQAEECDARESERWLAEQEVQRGAASLEAEVARAREAELDVKRAEYALQHPTAKRPALYDWAKTQGYGGRGRISNELRRRYAETFGLGHVPGQSVLVDDDEEE